MKRFNWLLTGLILLSLTTILLAGCVSKSNYGALQADYDTLQQQISSLSTQLQQAQQAQADLAELRAKLQADYDALQQQSANLSLQLQQAQSDLAELQAEPQADYSALQQQSANLSLQIQQAQSDLAELQADYDASQQQSANLSIQLQQAQSDLAAQLAEPLTIDQAADVVRSYLAPYGGGLVLAEVLEFALNFYAMVVEEDTGISAMELLVNKYTGQVLLEETSMMWDTKYGHNPFYPPTLDMPVSPEQAESITQQALDANMPGATTGEVHTFYGYYTLRVLGNGQVVGMLSVDGYTGEVRYHDWHGTFIGMKDFG